MLIGISAAGLAIFAILGAIFGVITRKSAPERNQVILGGAILASWLYLFIQAPMHIALISGLVSAQEGVIPILAGALLMVVLWIAGIPKKLPIIGKPIANFVIAFEKWHFGRAKKRIERLERELD